MTTAAIAELEGKHKKNTDRLRAINAAHPGGGDLGDDAAEWTRLDGEQRTIEAAHARESRVVELDRAAMGTPIYGSGDSIFDAVAGQVTAADVIRAQLPGVTDAAAGRAREVSAELARRSGRKPEGLLFSMTQGGVRPEQRVFTTTLPGGGPGSNLIQTDVAPYLIDRLRERLIVRLLGATVLSGLQGNLSIPRLKGSATAYWVPENTPITASDPQTDQVGMTPKHIGGLVEMGRNLILQPSIDVSRMVEDDLARVLAVGLDQAALVGGGPGQPSGLLAAGSGITILPLGTAGAAPTWDAVVGLIAAVDTSNALAGSLGFAANGRLTSKLRRTLKSVGDTSSNFIMSDAASLAGYPLASSQNVPSNGTKSTASNLSALIFGDWSMLVLAFWSELDLLVNPYESVAYSKGNVQIRAMATADIAIRQPLAFAAFTDAVTT